MSNPAQRRLGRWLARQHPKCRSSPHQTRRDSHLCALPNRAVGWQSGGVKDEHETRSVRHRVDVHNGAWPAAEREAGRCGSEVGPYLAASGRAAVMDARKIQSAGTSLRIIAPGGEAPPLRSSVSPRQCGV
jgi:hypothetical protein